ncbi:hypothetical protein AGDE_10919 [Angomonas deanei]|nr:hypothetical protein AGDE_10919 [Angomonas deanei]|eukprot:EPY27131.1 hypothetical protein AGDE_10919 [Angomonas deanei]
MSGDPSALYSGLSVLTVDEDVYLLQSEELVRLLQTPRPEGGYGGHLHYGEFAVLCTYLGFTTEQVEDCWYDTLMGQPLREVTDMERVAHYILCYCFSGNLTLPLPSAALLSEDHAGEELQKLLWQSGQETVLSSPSEVAVEPAPIVEQSTHLVESPRKATEKPKAKSAVRKAPSTHSTNSAPRYAASTACHDRRTDQTPSVKPTPKRSPSANPEVYNRLYQHAKEYQEKKKVAREKPAEEPIPSPKKTRASSKRRASSPSQVTYNKPTKAFYTKLIAQGDTQYDAIAEYPETPRVDYQPAPGPSTYIPPGYIEDVARRRRDAARRLEERNYQNSLRGPDFSRELECVRQNAILRLPLSTNRRESVDIQLNGL